MSDLDAANQARLLRKLRHRADVRTYPVLPGAVLHVGTRCAIDDRPLPSGQYAHAHNYARLKDDWFGLICIRPSALAGKGRSARDNPTPTGRARRRKGLPVIVWHEYAHLLVPGAGHTQRWRDVMRDLGCPQAAETYRQRYAASRKMDR